MTKHFRMSYVRPLGRVIPVDEELLAAWGRDIRALARKKELVGAIVVGLAILFAALLIAISLVTP